MVKTVISEALEDHCQDGRCVYHNWATTHKQGMLTLEEVATWKLKPPKGKGRKSRGRPSKRASSSQPMETKGGEEGAVSNTATDSAGSQVEGESPVVKVNPAGISGSYGLAYLNARNEAYEGFRETLLNMCDCPGARKTVQEEEESECKEENAVETESQVVVEPSTVENPQS